MATTTAKPRHRQQTARVKVDRRPLPEMPSADPYIRGETAKRLIRGAQKTAGVKLTWPADTQTVFSLCRLAGYRVDRAWLSYILRKGYIKFPAKQGGQMLWQLDDVVRLIDTAEAQRRWLDCHPVHASKYMPHELQAAQERVRERTQQLRELAGWSVQDLVDGLLRTPDAELRELIGMTLQSMSGATDVRGDGTEAPAADVSEN